MPYSPRHAEQGNVLFIILLAVVAFAALSYAVMGASGSDNGKNASEEIASLDTARISNYTSNVENAVLRLKMIKGCTDVEISYETPTGNDVNPTARAGQKCHVFHPNGAGVPWQDIDLGHGCSDDLTLLNGGESACGVTYIGTYGGKRIYAGTSNSAATTYASGGSVSLSPSAASASNGAANTDALMTIGGTEAAALCRLQGSKWYLPSKNELAYIFTEYTNYSSDLDGTLPNGNYWSSTLVNGSTAKRVNLNDNGSNIIITEADVAVTSSYVFRCIRSD